MYLPPYVPRFQPLFAYWIVTLNRLPGGGLEDPSCGYWHGTTPANDMSVHQVPGAELALPPAPRDSDC